MAPPSVLGDDSSRVRDAVRKITLDQPGTRPFHLKATVQASRDRDRNSSRTGEIEVWWTAPDRYRREFRSPQFRRIEIVNGAQHVNDNTGDYFPEWLRELGIEVIQPVFALDHVLEGVKGAEVKRFMGQTNFSWMDFSSDGQVRKAMGAGFAIRDASGLPLYWSDLGMSGAFDDYRDFHGRMVPRKVSSGAPEMTAILTVLEDLADAQASLFDPSSLKDAHALSTVMLDETDVRKHLLAPLQVSWPPVTDGPTEGLLTCSIVIDKTGSVRQLFGPISDNPAVNDNAKEAIVAARFAPFQYDGGPAQVLSRITMPFKTSRPAGTEVLARPQEIFERARKSEFPAASAVQPYRLNVEFETMVKGAIAKGGYTDAFQDPTHWYREAILTESRYARSQNGDQRYQISAGPFESLLRFILRAMEPLPAMDTFIESDWQVRRDLLAGAPAIRVSAGQDEQARIYWFDEQSRLTKAHAQSLDISYEDFQPFGNVTVPRRILIRKNGALALKLSVVSIEPLPAGSTPFSIPNHEWTRQFTDEVR